MRANIIVYPRPTANFFISAPTIKNGIDLQFQDASQGASSWNWDFGDPNSGVNNTSTIQTPTHNYATFGNYEITLIVANAYGCTDTIKKTYTVLNAVGIEDDLVKALQVYPNPFKDQIRMSGTIAESSEMYLSLNDMLGRTVAQSPVKQLTPGSFEMDWKLDNELTNGVYFLQLHINGKTQSVKLVHQN
jgi:PKD repeat protein